MENQHLTYFKVENFKKFDSLEVKDVGQFNLIVGDNNVGKTILLESLCLNLNPKDFLSDLEFILSKRDIQIHNIKFDINTVEFNSKANVVGLVQKHLNNPIRIINQFNNIQKNLTVYNKIDFNPIKDVNVKQFIEKVDLFQYKEINQLSKNWILFYSNDSKQKKASTENIIFLADVTSNYYKQFLNKSSYLPLIKLMDLYEDDLIEFLNRITSSPKDEEKIINILNDITGLNIKRIRTSEFINGKEYLQVSTSDREDYHLITEYGDGFIRILRIVIEIILNKSYQLCVDEIETGIHHSRLKDFLKNIMLVCKELDVQLFATTHSEECIKAFYEASIELKEEENIRLISLEEGKNEKIYATTNRFENIKAGLISNIEFRK